MAATSLNRGPSEVPRSTSIVKCLYKELDKGNEYSPCRFSDNVKTGEQSICWRNGPWWMSWRTINASTKPCPVWNSPMHRTGRALTGKQLAGKTWRTPSWTRTSTFAARKANCMLGCISKNDGVIISLSSAIVRLQLSCYIHLCSTRKTLTTWSQSSREPPRGWRMWCRRRRWESWACSGKRGEGKGETCLQIQNKTLLGAVCCKDSRQQTQTETWEILTYLRKMFCDSTTPPPSPASLLRNQSLLLGPS